MRKIHSFDPTWTIELLCDGNPKCSGSLARERFDLYLDQGTVAENLRRGVKHQDFVSDLGHGYIKLVMPGRPAADGLADHGATVNAASPRAE